MSLDTIDRPRDLTAERGGAASLVGLSSNCVPTLSADAFIALCRAHDVALVDLRTGRGQAWEQDASACFDALRVAFVGTSLSLPDRMDALDATAARAAEAGIALRVFVSEAAWRDAPQDVLAAWSALRRRLPSGCFAAVETHWRSTGIEPFIEMIERLSAKVVLDTSGLVRMRCRAAEQAAPLLPHAVALQVTGCDWQDVDRGHEPLAQDLRTQRLTAELWRLHGGPLPTTVETRSDSHIEDLAVLRRASARPLVTGGVPWP